MRVREDTEQKRAEHALAEAQERLRLALEAADLGTFEYQVGSEPFLDERARAILGLKTNEPVPLEAVMERLAPASRHEITDVLRGLHESAKETFVREFQTLDAAGEARWIEARGRFFPEQQRVLGILHDITERKHEDEFRERLLGIVSHDLRNPLSLIKASCSLLMRSPRLDRHLERHVGRMMAGVERMQLMIGDLLDFTRGRVGGGIPITPRMMDCAAEAQRIIDEAAILHPGREIELTTKGDGQGRWDPDRIAQVLGNLLSNALKYSPAEAPIRVEVEGLSDRVLLRVHNDGKPIPADLLPSIFEPFRRAPEQAGHSGLGLGLYIVYEITRAHRGTARVTSTASEGTTFTISLPR